MTRLVMTSRTMATIVQVPPPAAAAPPVAWRSQPHEDARSAQTDIWNARNQREGERHNQFEHG